MLKRALDAKHIGDERFIHSLTCAVHQTAFFLMYKLVHLHPTHDADNDRTWLKDKSAQDTLQSDSHVPLPHTEGKWESTANQLVNDFRNLDIQYSRALVPWLVEF